MQELRILNTETDFTTNDISKMSDFFGLYINDLRKSIEFENAVDSSIGSVATVGIIAEALRFGQNINPSVNYVADFSTLPKEALEQFKNGELVFQNSHIAPGNVTNCLVLKNGKGAGKIKYNLSLKEVKNTPNNAEIVKNILIMMQLKQINEKLDSLYDMMNYQNKMIRNQGLFTPFFEGVHYIGNAQGTNIEEERVKYLDKAIEYLNKAYEFASLDLVDCSGILAQKTKNPILRKHNDVRKYMIYMSEDINVINKCAGLQLLIYRYQKKEEETEVFKLRYASRMYSLVNEAVGVNGETAIGILQDNYPYRKENNNMWYEFYNRVIEFKKICDGIEDNKKTFYICGEA